MNWETPLSVLSVIATVIGLAVKYIAPLVGIKVDAETVKISAEKQKQLGEKAAEAVAAAEQIYRAIKKGKVVDSAHIDPDTGEFDKRGYAIEVVTNAGYEEIQANSAIEAAVGELNGGGS